MPFSSLVEALRRRAQEQPDRIAFRFLDDGERESGALTYAQLDRRARSIAQALASRSCAGQPVVLVYPSSLELVAALYGCFYAGAVPAIVPAMIAQRAFERAPRIVADAQPTVGLTRSDLLARADAAQRGELPWIATDTIADDDAASPPRLPGGDDVALLQYTSGSTSAPRAIVLSHRNLTRTFLCGDQCVALDERSRIVSWLPLYHDMGLLHSALWPVWTGALSVLMPPLAFVQRPLRWLRAIARYGGTFTMAPPFALDLCVRRTGPEQRQGLDLSSWRCAGVGAEPVRPEVLERFAAAFAPQGFDPLALRPCYGLAEVTVLATMPAAGEPLRERVVDSPSLANRIVEPPRSAERQRRLLACGGPWGAEEVAIVEPETCRQLAKGELGEIWLRGDCVAQGYWRRPEETARAFGAAIAGDPRAGWLRTGDLGFLGPEGLFITGRLKDLIIVRGANYDPLDLEVCAAESHPALVAGRSAAFSIDTAEGEAVVIACEVERTAIRGLDVVGITGSVVEALSRAFGLSLHDLVLVSPAALPRTTSGKVQRQLCKAQYLRGELSTLEQEPHASLGRWRPKPA